MVDVAGYIARVMAVHKTGVATEHSYRSALEYLFDNVEPGVTALNEPKSVKVGRPDFVFQRTVGTDRITVGHCEAKDLGFDVSPKGLKDANKAQFERYVKALPNLIYTNCLDFRFYKNGELVREISIADYLMGIQSKPDQYQVLANQLRDFCGERLQTITSAETLAETMAGKAVLIKDILFNTLKEDRHFTSELAGQFKAFKDQLIHDLDSEEFADIYAETIAYGLFAARLHDSTVADFSREEALKLLPKSNPFLRKLFEFVAGPGLDDAIRRTVDELAEVFQATNLTKLFENFGSFTQRNDPFIHFYETFLAKYNPSKRKARGVWYTPEPVVNFIVGAVDEVLKSEFGLPMGLADTSKITIDWDTGQTDKKGKAITIKKEMHRVQILDPAAGTGTFLAEVIKQIAPKVKGVGSGQWSSYVEKELIPRLHGFELLMASYAMCHMKLDMMLTELKYKPTKEPPRLGVYLTNSLEEGAKANQTLPFAQWLSNEAKEANTVKRDVPVMCVVGNPPYSGESANKGDWIKALMDSYKKEPGGKQKLKERNPKWINDDYVKFIRLAEHMIAKTGEGVLGFITNHGYLDNPTFRGMRWHLLKTFDKIWVLDLHGNTKKKEVAPDGSADRNVFDIQQGVALIIAVKTNPQIERRKKPLATIWHGDLWGSRKTKYDALWSKNIKDCSKEELDPHPKYQMFYPVDDALLDNYDAGFSLNDLFEVYQIGLTTSRDHVAVGFSVDDLRAKIAEFADPKKTDDEIRLKYFPSKNVKDDRLSGDTASWSLSRARSVLKSEKWDEWMRELDYRPFDRRAVIYSECMIERPRADVIPHMFEPNNYALSFNRKIDELRPFYDAFVFERPIQLHSLSIKESNYFAPLYVFDNLDQSRRVNMNPAVRKRIEKAVTDAGDTIPDETAIFDYIYGVLYCPSYRETYREFLKIDFPKIPYPRSAEIFWDVSAKGTHLRRLHLMDDSGIGETPYPFTGDGDSEVRKAEYESGVVFINDTQSFENVPVVAWEFIIGGYRPAQKWLKDRKGRNLSFDDVRHYQRIIKILYETDRIMKTIEMPLN